MAHPYVAKAIEIIERLSVYHSDCNCVKEWDKLLEILRSIGNPPENKDSAL